MAPDQSKGMLVQLSSFSLGLKEYQAYLVQHKTLTRKQIEDAGRLRQRLVRDVGKAGPIIKELTGKETIKPRGKGPEYSYDMWQAAFKVPFDERSYNALTICIDYADRTIGKLESDIQTGLRDKWGKLINGHKAPAPKCFISHGTKTTALTRLSHFLEALGVIPLIVMEQPSTDQNVNDKVNNYLSQADFVIVLATADDNIRGKLYPRQNVIHEIGLAQQTHSGRIIYLLEDKAHFPSNINSKVWQRFNRRNIEKAFTPIVKEIRTIGLLNAVRPH